MNKPPKKKIKVDEIICDMSHEICLLKFELKKYKQMAMHDTLTGLYNRRKLEQDIPRYLNLQKRNGVHFLVLMIDINKFKEVNDKKGHKIGDKLLVKVAKVLRKSVRNIDKVYRLSGDEFVVILSHCIKDKVSWRVKELLADEKIEISIGKSLLCDNILDIVDRKMYEEKRRK